MQLIEMFSHQTDREFRIMMGTDVRIKRDPLAMRMGEDQIKQSIYSMDFLVHYLYCLLLLLLSCSLITSVFLSDLRKLIFWLSQV